MKMFKYLVKSAINVGTQKSPRFEDYFYTEYMSYSEQDEELVKTIAYNGEYEIIDDFPLGVEEFEITTPTSLDALEAQIIYTAMMTDTLLTEV